MSITLDELLTSYTHGFFPMGSDRTPEKLEWHSPNPRGILPLDAFHVPKRLRQTMRKKPYEITFDRDFAGVIRGCADTRNSWRGDTWINGEIVSLYTALHKKGFAHSAEAWKDGALVGGVYGVTIQSAFFGESMFSTATDASKIALVHLVDHLKARGYTLFDTQMKTRATAQFGVIEIPRDDYLKRLMAALKKPASFAAPPPARAAGPRP